MAVTIKIPDVLEAELHKLAKETDSTLVDVVKGAIQLYAAVARQHLAGTRAVFKNADGTEIPILLSVAS